MNDPVTQIQTDIASVQDQTKLIRQIYEGSVLSVSTRTILGTSKVIALLRKNSPEAGAALGDLQGLAADYEGLQEDTTKAAANALVSIQDAEVCFQRSPLADDARKDLRAKIDSAHGLLKATHARYAAKVIGCAKLFDEAANQLSAESKLATSTFEQALEGAVAGMKQAVEATKQSQAIPQAAQSMQKIMLAMRDNPADLPRLMSELVALVVSLQKLARDISCGMARAYVFLETAQLALDDEIESKNRPEAEEALNKLKEAFSGKMRKLEFVVDSALVLASLPSALQALKDRKAA